MEASFLSLRADENESDSSVNVLVDRQVCSVEEVVQIKLEDPLIIVSVIICVIINVAVIAGNILVIVAVFFSSKLRTITNFFIVSLAVSDLLLGVAILPYSLPLHVHFTRNKPSLTLLFQVFDVWIFGEVWCMGWLVIDVWLSTASILNLCAISVDRYLAVTRPVRYRSIMTSRKAKLMIAAVWIASFIICFPPLLGWNNQGSLIIQDKLPLENFHATCYNVGRQCALFDEKAYVIYSALGSFYIPMSVMLFFYWRIYLVASRTTSALKRGYKTKKSSKGPEERLTLRIHRGYMCDDTVASTSLVSYPAAHHNSSTKSNKSLNSLSTSPRTRTGILKQSFDDSCLHANCTELKSLTDGQPRRKMPVTVYRSQRLTASMAMNPQQIERERSPSNQSNMSQNSVSSGSSAKDTRNKLAANRFSRRTNTGKWHTRRFLAETKAAKTVGIIVGGFIICWFPFFTVYLLRAFYKDQIPEIVLTIFYWLGYFNSAVNPVIYGLFSRDFRRAFKNIVCKCRFREETGVTSLIRQIHLPNLFEEDIANNEDIAKPHSDEN
ncbi:putative G-protein coupled receptor No9-like protein [Leptotrombidium deliense]|uniref:Putative G-protein coupled receptor No9-like protein n=1 Tax=Leptotrombidium deliense TaxID=299467 RepID=A0A443SU69_9ACAR|nr:putative G-protein coupled receptor No9-like protein [Leptotrombidium deliense]